MIQFLKKYIQNFFLSPISYLGPLLHFPVTCIQPALIAINPSVDLLNYMQLFGLFWFSPKKYWGPLWSLQGPGTESNIFVGPLYISDKKTKKNN